MKTFLKKYIRPLATVLGLENIAYSLLMKSIAQRSTLSNTYNQQFKATARILTYHRVATVADDPRLLCVTPALFEEHLTWLTKNYTVIPLLELHRRITEKKIIGNEVVISLDDGYRDNLTTALPILERYQAPATIFVTTAWLGQKASLPWDLEYSYTDRAHFLTADEVATLAKHPLITIGAHTHTHPRLSNLQTTEQATELQQSKEILEEITGQTITVLAYPFGGIFDVNATTKELAKSSGFTLACATIPRLVTNTSPLYALPRINIRNYPTKVLANYLFI